MPNRELLSQHWLGDCLDEMVILLDYAVQIFGLEHFNKSDQTGKQQQFERAQFPRIFTYRSFLKSDTPDSSERSRRLRAAR